MRHCECSRPLCEKESFLANTRSLLRGQEEEEEEEDKRKIDCCGTNLSRRGEFSVLILVLGNKAGRRQSVCLWRALDYLTDGWMGCSFHECKWCYPKSGITYGDDRKQSQYTAENKTHTEEALERSSVARGIQAGADTYTSRLDRVTAPAMKGSGWWCLFLCKSGHFRTAAAAASAGDQSPLRRGATGCIPNNWHGLLRRRRRPHIRNTNFYITNGTGGHNNN